MGYKMFLRHNELIFHSVFHELCAVPSHINPLTLCSALP